MTYTQYDKTQPDTSNEVVKDTDASVFNREQHRGSQPEEKPFQEIIHDKIDAAKSSIQQSAQKWRDDIMEPFEDRSDQNNLKREEKGLGDKIKESARDSSALNEMFKDSDKGKESQKDRESYQEILQDKIDAAKSSIQQSAQKWRDDIMEPFEDRSDEKGLDEKVNEQSSKVTSAFKEMQEKGSETQKDHESYQEMLQDKIDEGKDVIKETTHKWKENIVEPFEDRSDEKDLNEKVNEQSSKVTNAFKEMQEKGSETQKDHESYQEMLQDKIDEGKDVIKETAHKWKENIAETFQGRSDPNEEKQAEKNFGDKTKEQLSKASSALNENFKNSGRNNVSTDRQTNEKSRLEDGFKTFGQQAKEEYEKDKKQAEEAKAEWAGALESVEHTFKHAIGIGSETDGERKVDGGSPEYRDFKSIKESSDTMTHPFSTVPTGKDNKDPAADPFSEEDTLSFFSSSK